jgi:hypothetical protein
MKRAILSLCLIPALLCLLFVPGCKDEAPPVVWDPANAGGTGPTITSVSPPAGALGAITEVTITGTNFAPVDTQNVVFFGNSQGTVKSATLTSIVVIPPDISVEGLTIKVSVPGAYQLATFGPYKLEHASVEYGGFGDLDEVYALALDKSENLFVQFKDSSKVYKITPASVKTRVGTLTFPKASDMKVGPGGFLYFQQTNSTQVHRIAAGGGTSTVFATMPGRASACDFDSAGNYYAGGTGNGMFVVNPNAATREVGSFRGLTIRGVRVFAGAVYAAVSAPTSGVWKSRILNSQGDLEAPVKVFDMATAPGTFPASAVLSIAFAADGQMYIGTDNRDPILVVSTDGSSLALYAGTLIAPATQMEWGNDTYLYVNRYNVSLAASLRRVIRVSMGKPGAPEYGRQ